MYSTWQFQLSQLFILAHDGCMKLLSISLSHSFPLLFLVCFFFCFAWVPKCIYIVYSGGAEGNFTLFQLCFSHIQTMNKMVYSTLFATFGLNDTEKTRSHIYSQFLVSGGWYLIVWQPACFYNNIRHIQWFLRSFWGMNESGRDYTRANQCERASQNEGQIQSVRASVRKSKTHYTR